MDPFLARKYPTQDSRGQPIYKCTIIEIKRPSIALNTKHLRQLEDYAQIIKRFPEFSSERTHFELILVGRKISSDDTLIQGRKNDLIDREMGLTAELPRMKLYVMDWYTLLDSFDLSNDFMLEHLKLRRAEFCCGESREKLIGETAAATLTGMLTLAAVRKTVKPSETVGLLERMATVQLKPSALDVPALPRVLSYFSCAYG